jgi:hypothetical protein
VEAIILKGRLKKELLSAIKLTMPNEKYLKANLYERNPN